MQFLIAQPTPEPSTPQSPPAPDSLVNLPGLTNGLILLLATALVSGLLVPFVVNKIQARNQQRLKTFEIDLARQSKIVEEQSLLVERISRLLWTFQLALIAPLYYGQRAFHGGEATDPNEPDPSSAAQPLHRNAYEDAAKNYVKEASQLLGSIRAEVGAAIRLVPREQWEALRKLYYRELLPLDAEVTRLIFQGPSEASSKDWRAAHTRVLSDLAIILDNTIDDLASALSLKYVPSHPDNSPVSPADPSPNATLPAHR